MRLPCGRDRRGVGRRREVPCRSPPIWPRSAPIGLSHREHPLWRPSFAIALLMSAVGVLHFFAITFEAL